MVISRPRPAPGDAARLGRRLGLAAFWPPGRIRRPLDRGRLLVATAALLALVVPAVVDPGLLAGAAGVGGRPSGGLTRAGLAVANVAASVAVLVSLLAIAVDAVRFRRFALASALAAFVAGPLLGLAVALLARLRSETALTLLLGPPHESAGLPVTAVTAFLVGADLQRRAWSGRSRLALAVAVGCSLALGSLTVPGALLAVLVGCVAGLAVRLGFGVLPARPPDDVVRSVLAGGGWQLSDLRPIEEAPGRVRYAGTRPDGGEVRVTVVDPDRRGVPFVRRAWRVLRLRSAAVGHPALSLRGLVEQQALSLALAQSAAVATPRLLGLLAAGPALVLVEQPLAGRPLSEAEGPAAASGSVAAMRELCRLHGAGLAHGSPTADDVLLLEDGRAGFRHLGTAQPAATELQRELDVVALLVAAAQQAGSASAVAALRTGYGTTPASEHRLAALLQPLALPRQVRRSARREHLLRELRSALSGPEGGGAVTAPRLERIRPRTVLSIVAATLAAYLLAGQLSQVDLVGALQEARPGWAALTLVGSAITYLGAALALLAFTPVVLPLGRTVLVQLASSFLTLVTPPAVGQVGLNIRYLQRAEVPLATAGAVIAVKEALTVVVTVVLVLVCGWLSGLSASRLTLLPSGDVLAVLAVVGAVLALLVAVPATRRLLLRRVEPLLRRTLPQLLAAASDPRRVTGAVAGVLLLNAGYVLALDASLKAFSASLDLPTLVVVFLAASTLGSAAPTPGGLGAIEAALVGGLTATGVPVAAALTAVLAYRTATFWVPAPLGYLAMLWLQRRNRV